VDRTPDVRATGLAAFLTDRVGTGQWLAEAVVTSVCCRRSRRDITHTLCQKEGAHHCGRSIRRFEVECPVRPIRFPNGDLRWDVQDLDGCPPHIRPAIGLMTFTGLSPRDALTLPRGFYKANEIATNRSKTGEPVFWPCPVPLTEDLGDGAPLREGRRPQTQNARGGTFVRRRTEQTENKNCQTYRIKVSNPP
jgi:hypothetical protein